MYPHNPTDRGRGYSVILLEPGERCDAESIGAKKPDRWLCTLWDGDTILQRESLCDVIGRRPTMFELAMSAANHPELWRAITPKALP